MKIDAQRHADLGDVQPVGPPARARRPRRPGRAGRRPRAAPGAISSSRFGFERQAVDRRRRSGRSRARRRRRGRWPRGSRPTARGAPRPTRCSQASLAAPGAMASSPRGGLGPLGQVAGIRVEAGRSRFAARSRLMAILVPAVQRGPDLDRVDHRPRRRGPGRRRAPATTAASDETTEAVARSRHRPAGQGAQEPLARGADQDGTSQVGKSIEVPQELQVVLERLAEADPRVDRDPLAGDARAPRPRRSGAAR